MLAQQGLKYQVIILFYFNIMYLKLMDHCLYFWASGLVLGKPEAEIPQKKLN